jgi:hypothetical protein
VSDEPTAGDQVDGDPAGSDPGPPAPSEPWSFEQLASEPPVPAASDLWGAPPAPAYPWLDTSVPPQEPPRRRRRLRTVLLSLLVLLTITGLVWGGMAVADQKRKDRERREAAARVAAEKRAAAAYITALRPLVIRVFDDVQPVQDVYDAFAHPRPGLAAARDDVILHGGGLRDLKTLKVALDRLRAPTTYVSQISGLSDGLQSLVASMLELERTSHDKPDSHGFIEAFGSAFEGLLTAEVRWADAVSVLDPKGAWPLPDEKRAQARGRKVPTASSFILGSDLACGKSNAALEFEDFKRPARTVLKTYPKVSKEIRALVVQLRAVPHPARQRAFQHRLEIGWSASVDVAKEFDAVTAAYRHRDPVAYDRAFKRLLEALDQMLDLGRAYKAQGVSMCAGFFGTGDGKSKGGSSTTA